MISSLKSVPILLELSLPLLNVNQVPENLYLVQCQTVYSKKLFRQCNLSVQIEQVQDKDYIRDRN